MTLEQFIFKWTHNYLIVAMQATIAVENYGDNTVMTFYEDVDQASTDALDVYNMLREKFKDNKSLSEEIFDSILENCIFELRSRQVQHFIDVVKDYILPQSTLKEYNVEEQYRYFSSKKTNNAFIDIIKDIRSKEEKDF